MIDALSNAFAHGMIKRCTALLPPERRRWAEAMKRELEVIESPHARVGFATGCVWASLKERTLRMDFAVKAVRLATVAAMLVVAAFGALSAWHITASNAPTAMVLGVSSVVFATAALWSVLRGPIALVQTATMMLIVYAFALVFLTKSSAASGWVNGTLYRALATEGLFIWGALLVAGLFLVRGLTEAARDRS